MSQLRTNLPNLNPDLLQLLVFLEAFTSIAASVLKCQQSQILGACVPAAVSVSSFLTMHGFAAVPLPVNAYVKAWVLGPDGWKMRGKAAVYGKGGDPRSGFQGHVIVSIGQIVFDPTLGQLQPLGAQIPSQIVLQKHACPPLVASHENLLPYWSVKYTEWNGPSIKAVRALRNVSKQNDDAVVAALEREWQTLHPNLP
ncbi:hypothetical protein [Azospirillum sp. TSO5]|uniref:hypothetical protein n=1 Tax=Azospirillum sp. TSO5 TaxID=716760 RepID=UPI000D6042C7|nr:hypothetical protein [Azospirillum sp. TSO5]PWC91880.1 hypothetical protein TSO5_18670 [Azospirillum sp. TSO5]